MKDMCARSLWYARISLVWIVLFQLSLGSFLAIPARADDDHRRTETPIKHVIVIIGENRSFDHVFATYKPKDGQSVDNLLSKGIVNDDGTPGPNFWKAHQFSADVTGSSKFELSPRKKSLYPYLPAPLNGGPTDVCKNNGICVLADAMSSETELSDSPVDYYEFLTSGGTGLTGKVPDSRITGVSGTAPYSTLLPGPFQLSNGSTFTYDSYANSPVHRFYQMWQQEDCNVHHATWNNPSGCKADLFPWVEVTVGAGTNGLPPASNFSTDYSPTAKTTGEGSTSMGFYNVQQGDMPYFKELADHYSMSDNYHQAGMGGTGLNHILLGYGDGLWFSDGNGNPATPPHNQTVFAGTPNAGIVDEIEDPDPASGTNNWYTEDGYGGGAFGSSSFGGGSYSDCSDSSQPGVDQVRDYLRSLWRPVDPRCEQGKYYLLNNYNPGYFGDGSNAFTDTNTANTPFTIPPTSQRHIGDVMNKYHVSWKYYGDQWNQYLTDKYQLNYGTVGANSDQYCNICNPFQYSTSTMTDADQRADHLADVTDFYTDIQAGKLPAVSFLKPSGWADGHPASSKFDIFEGFVRKVVQAVKAKPELWESTAIMITVDEGGGYYDSGYVQPLDFFGDGTRIPMIVVSPYSRGGKISHVYSDHVSIAKFIEKNWNLEPITRRSRDNFPNPKSDWNNPYVPENSPAIGDLMDLFDFDRDHDGH
jgi:phospholipase C